MENFIAMYHSILFSIIVGIFLFACVAIALAEENAIIQEISPHKSVGTFYVCTLP